MAELGSGPADSHFTRMDRLAPSSPTADRKVEHLLVQQDALLTVITHPTFQGSDEKAILDLLTETAARGLNMPRVGVWRFTPSRDAVTCLSLFDLGASRHIAGTTLTTSPFPRYLAALASGEAICADDARQDPRTSELAEAYLNPLGVTSMMAVPLIVDGRVEGVVCYEHVGAPRPWTPADRRFAIAIGNLTVLAFERSSRIRLARDLVDADAKRQPPIAAHSQPSGADYRTLVEGLGVVVFQADASGAWTFLNPAWTNLTGYEADAGTIRNLSDCVHQDDQMACRHFFQSLAGHRTGHRIELRLSTATGDTRWVEVFASPTVDREGLVVGSAGTITDVTARKADDARIQRLAYQDSLTTLPNRASVLERLDWALASAKRERKRVAVLFLDLDGFKHINDSLGHAVGDALLTEVGGRLKGLLRGDDIVGRFGGDEFLVVLPAFQAAADARTVCAKAMATLARPFVADGHQLQVSASIGVSVYPDDAGHRDALIRCADTALYRAKNIGAGIYEFFSPDVRST